MMRPTVTLLADYGPIMDSKAICKVLRYPSINALHAAKGRGALPFEPLIFENRRGIFALTEEIAAAIHRATKRPNLDSTRPSNESFVDLTASALATKEQR